MQHIKISFSFVSPPLKKLYSLQLTYLLHPLYLLIPFYFDIHDIHLNQLKYATFVRHFYLVYKYAVIAIFGWKDY
jgi:hypothetical protein